MAKKKKYKTKNDSVLPSWTWRFQFWFSKIFVNNNLSSQYRLFCFSFSTPEPSSFAEDSRGLGGIQTLSWRGVGGERA